MQLYPFLITSLVTCAHSSLFAVFSTITQFYRHMTYPWHACLAIYIFGVIDVTIQLLILDIEISLSAYGVSTACVPWSHAAWQAKPWQLLFNTSSTNNSCALSTVYCTMYCTPSPLQDLQLIYMYCTTIYILMLPYSKSPALALTSCIC